MAPGTTDRADIRAAVDARFPDRTLPGLLRHHAGERGEAPAVTFDGVTWTYAQLVESMDQVAAALLASGMHPGDRVAYLGKNNAEFAALWAGAAAAGIVLIPLNWRLALPEVAEILADGGARILFLGPDYLASAEPLQTAVPGLELVIRTDHAGPDGFAAWQGQHLTTGRGTRVAHDRQHIAGNGSVALQLYTAGTTGRAKGVLLSHDSLFWQRAASAVQGIACDCQLPDDVLLVSLTVSHVAGLVSFARAFFAGGHAVVLREFDSAAVLEAIARHRVSRLTLVPATLQLLLRTQRALASDTSSVRIMQYGASPIPIDLLEEGLAVFGCEFVQVYGMTEAGGAVTALGPEDHALPATPRMKSVGRALPGVEIRIADAAGQPVEPGTVGEIQLRTGSLMQGYWQLPEATAQALTADGFYRSGDAGYCDEAGYIYLCDRIKDMVVTGGENVYPAEVEHALSSHPAVAEAAVFGVPDPRWGEAVKAVIVLHPGAAATEGELIAHVRARIAGFKAPKSIDFAAELPRNAAGKVLRRKLAEPHWAGRERRIA